MKKISILIIDRDKSNINKIKFFFNKNQKIKIFQAQNMRESLIIVIKNQIDLIIYDFQMPYFNSFEIAKIVQKNSINKDISFLFVGYSFEKEFYNNEILEKYSIEYINKPINGFSLQTKIDKYVSLVV